MTGTGYWVEGVVDVEPVDAAAEGLGAAVAVVVVARLRDEERPAEE